MKKKKILISSIIVVVVIALIGVTVMFNNNKNKSIAGVGNAVKDNPTAVIPVSSTSVKLSCFDFIDKQLVADGFTFLGGTKWGRGEKNLFIVDLAKQEFETADSNHLNVVPENWYSTEYDRYVDLVYKHETSKVIIMDYVRVNSTLPESEITVSAAKIAEPDNQYHEFPIWMNYYVSQFEGHGCSITGLTEAKLGEYKTKTSKATMNDVVSVFDVKSTDGTISTFADVHTTGKVEDSPRYKEINSLDEFIALKDASGFEVFYMYNILNTNTSKTFEADRTGLVGNAIKEFVKDVVYSKTLSTDVANETQKGTLGVYFINIDNQNKNFSSMYMAPTKGTFFSYPKADFSKDLRTLKMPFEGTVFGANKVIESGYEFELFSVGNIGNVLEEYIRQIKMVNPDVKFSSDFVYNYTRPFDINFQARFGLEKLFSEKFNLIDYRKLQWEVVHFLK